MDSLSFLRYNKARRVLAVASGAALLAVVAPGLAQTPAQAQGKFPVLPAPPSMPESPAMTRANMTASPTATHKLTPIPFRAPTPRTIRVSKINAANAYPYVNRAAKALGAGNTAEALSLYRRAYQLDPTNKYAAPGVGTALLIQGKFAEAATTFRNHLATNPGDMKTLRGLADSLTFSRKYREALGVNNYILARAPRNFASLFQNAQIATYAGDYKLSETYFNRASGVNKSNAKFWTSWGESLSYRRNPRALNAFNRALQLQPNDVRATMGIADYYIYTSQFGKAIEPLQTVLALEPNNTEALVGLGDSLAYTNQPRDAVAPYQRALHSNPTTLKRVWDWAARSFMRAATRRAKPNCVVFWRFNRAIARLWKLSPLRKTRRHPRRRCRLIKPCSMAPKITPNARAFWLRWAICSWARAI